jgi:hypothetical protein
MQNNCSRNARSYISWSMLLSKCFFYLAFTSDAGRDKWR